MKDETIRVLWLGTLAAGFGGFCIYMGHNSTVILGVFAFLGALAGVKFGWPQIESKLKEEKKDGG